MAVEKGCGRFEWCVLGWNESAIKFYERIGAKPQNEWVIYRLSGAELTSFASTV
jgi:RimJ/RimL family protein N-acetyltransferase